MTDDEIVKLFDLHDDDITAHYPSGLIAFARAIERRAVEREREACAKVCDSLSQQMTLLQLGRAEAGYISWISWRKFGEAVLARSEVKP